jgi:hypothetical protein
MNARTGIKMDFSCFWGYIIAVKKPQQRVWLQAIGVRFNTSYNSGTGKLYHTCTVVFCNNYIYELLHQKRPHYLQTVRS